MLSALVGCAGEVAEVILVDASVSSDVFALQGDTPTAPDAIVRPDVADVPAMDAPVMDVSTRDVTDASTRDVVDVSDVPVDTDPPPPTFPARIGHLTFAIRTGSGANDGTDANTLSLCLSETRCFPMNVADVNDFRRGEMDVYHFEGVDLPRSAVDRVEIRSANGTDAWRPTCVEMQWDGEPVHCADGLTGLFGNATGELSRWRDPAGVHRGCASCYPDLVTHGPVVGAVTPSAARVMVRSDATRQVVLRVLDVRYGRDTPGPTSARIMTEAQTAWLEGELMRSTATFKLIASGTNFSAGAGESWAQYPASRDRLFSFLAANRIGGVVLLSGDIHRSHLRRIRRANGYELPEVVSSPLANSTTTCPTTAPDATQVACYGAGSSFVTLEVDTRASDPRLLARILDVDGIERGRMEVRKPPAKHGW